MTRLALLVLVLLAALSAPAAAQPAPDVVVAGVTGLRWSDVGPDTPALRRLAQRGAVGVLSVKAVPDLTCRADGWLTLGAGTRAQAFPERAQERCEEVALADLEEQARRNAATLDGARVGALRDVLGPRAVADGEGARLALGLPALGAVPAPPALRPGVRLVDLGGLADQPTPGEVRRLDDRVAALLAELPSSTDVLVVGVGEPDQDATADLAVAIAAGPSFERGALRSASTRRAPYVQLVDVAPTVLSLLGEPVPAVMDGEPWQVRGPAPSTGDLRALSERATTARETTVPFFTVLASGLLVAFGALRRSPGRLALAARAGTAAVGASYAAQLVPWERSPAPLATLLALVAALALGTALLVRSVGVVCGLVAGLLVLDLLAGAPLQMDAVAGYSPLVAGRFAGLGNVAFGVYGAAAVLATAFAAAGRPRRRAAAVVAVSGALAVVVLGGWGSDVGGVLALVPAYALLGLRVTGARVTAPRLLLALAGAAAVVTALALLDLARPAPDRTHLGRFAVDVRDGTAGDLLVRKATSVLDLLLTSPVTAALPLVVAGAVWLLLRPPPPLARALEREPGLRHGLPAVGLLSAVGFVVNDSGAAVPALALLVAVPATLAVVAREAGRAAPVA